MFAAIRSSVCSLLLVAPAAFAGAIFTSQERDAASGEVRSTVVLSADGGRLLVEHLPAGSKEPDNAVIFRDGGMLIIDHEDKTYVELDRAALQSMASALNKAMKQLEETSALTPEQKAAIAQMMGAQFPDASKQKMKAELRDTGHTEKVAGHSCRVWEMTSGGQVRWQHCLVDPRKLEGGEQMLGVLKQVSTMMEELTNALDSPWMKEILQDSWEGFDRLDGYPVLTRSFNAGKPDTETVLESSRTASIEASRFQPPAGYKKQSMDVGAMR